MYKKNLLLPGQYVTIDGVAGIHKIQKAFGCPYNLFVVNGKHYPKAALTKVDTRLLVPPTRTPQLI